NHTYELANLYQDEMHSRLEDGTIDKSFKERFDQVQLTYENFNLLLEIIEEKDWGHLPEGKLAFLRSVQNTIELGEDYGSYSSDELAQELEYNQILRVNSLPYEHESYSISSTNFIKVVFENILNTFGLAVLLFFLGISLVLEKEAHTIRTIMIQPISGNRLVFSKFLSQMITTVYAVSLLLIVSYIIPLLFGGHKGSFLYPQVISYEEGFKHITLGYYLFLYFTIFIGLAAFIFSLNLLFNVLFRNRLTVLFLSFTTLFGGVYLTNQFTFLQVKMNPFYYFQTHSVVENQQK